MHHSRGGYLHEGRLAGCEQGPEAPKTFDSKPTRRSMKGGTHPGSLETFGGAAEACRSRFREACVTCTAFLLEGEKKPVRGSKKLT